MSGETFAYGALVLLLTNLLNRVLAFAYRILIVRLLGAEGVGLYEMVFPIYSLALVVSTAGLPIALSKLTAERMARGEYGQARRTFRMAAVVLLCTGLVSALVFWRLTPFLSSKVLADPRAHIALVAVVPALSVVPVCSAFRGFFQGIGQLSRPALSQVAEQVVRVAIGLYLARYLLPLGLDHAAGGLVVGMVAGEAAGFAYLLFIYLRERPLRMSARRTAPLGLLATWGEMWRLALPVTIGRIVTSLTFALEAVLIPQRLHVAGFSLRQATELYGQFSGIAFTLLYLPTVLTMSLATAMVPAVADATARKQTSIAGQRISDALRVTLVGGLPFVVLYIMFPHELTWLLFGNVQAGETLRILAWGGIFIYLQQTSAGILQGLGRTDLAMRNSLVGAALGLGGIYWLTALPAYGIRGSAVSIVVSTMIACYLNLSDIVKNTGLVVSWQPTRQSLVAGAAMAAACHYLYQLLWQTTTLPLALLVATAAGMSIYFSWCYATGTVSRRDLGRLPWLGQWFRG